MYYYNTIDIVIIAVVTIVTACITTKRITFAAL